jgi:CBS domain-containing protein
VVSRTVEDVMTRKVLAVRESTPFKDIVRTLRRGGVSAVPVVDSQDRVLGVVSEADLMLKEEALDRDPPPMFERRRRRGERARAAAKQAEELMSTPAVTISPLASIIEAARTMHGSGVKRLPVVDEAGRLVGIVSRSDLIKVFLRSDQEISRDAEYQLALPLRMRPDAIRLSVRNGVVRVEGRVKTRGEFAATVDCLKRIDGVVAVDNALSFEVDDEESGTRFVSNDLARP